MLARAVAADAGSMEAFRKWLRATSEDGAEMVQCYEPDSARAYLAVALAAEHIFDPLLVCGRMMADVTGGQGNAAAKRRLADGL